MYTASICLADDDGTFNSMGQGMIVNYDGVPLATGNDEPDEIITAEVRPRPCDEARVNWEDAKAIGGSSQRTPRAGPGTV